MKKYICRNIIVIIYFSFLIIYMNYNRYENYNIPWFYMDYIPVYMISFILLLINAFSHKLLDNKYCIFFYLNLLLTSSILLIKEIEIMIFVLFALVLISSFMVNIMYNKHKLAGYLLLPYLIYNTYLLIMNLTIILTN